MYIKTLSRIEITNPYLEGERGGEEHKKIRGIIILLYRVPDVDNFSRMSRVRPTTRFYLGRDRWEPSRVKYARERERKIDVRNEVVARRKCYLRGANRAVAFKKI